MPKQLEVRGVSVAYDGTAVVQSVDLALSRGEIGCLLGPSGCGKTTLLRAIAGFEPISSGDIRLRDRTMSTSSWTVPPEVRRVGMLFQDFALFPHLTVARNIAFGLRDLGRRERRARVGELLVLVGLAEVAGQHPHQLSGGQQQRVALARAMAPRPDILLLDEPFSSVDAERREQLAREVRGVLRREGCTAILVTHDQHEAFAMADRIAVMADGRIHQDDSAYALYHAPADRLVADFIGQGTWLQARVIDDRRVETELGTLTAPVPHGLPAGTSAEVLLRPDAVTAEDQGPLRAEITARTFRGAEYLCRLRLPSGSVILCLLPSHDDRAVGSSVGICARVENPVIFAADRRG